MYCAEQPPLGAVSLLELAINDYDVRNPTVRDRMDFLTKIHRNPPGEPERGPVMPVTTKRKLTTVCICCCCLYLVLFLSGDAPLIPKKEVVSLP